MMRQAELTKRADVVNVKLYPQINLSNTAAAAGIAVAFACLSALLSPTWAVVLFVATLPIEIQSPWLCGGYSFGVLPSVVSPLAYVRAKTTIARAPHSRWGSFKFPSTLFTYSLGAALAAGGNVIGRMVLLPIAKTPKRAKVCGLSLPKKVTQLTGYWLATLIAVQRNLAALHSQPPTACLRAAVRFIGTPTNERHTTPRALFVQPRGGTPALFGAIRLWLVGVCRRVVLKFLAALGARCGYFLHSNALQLTTVSLVIIAHPCG